ncbi:hypothetical protein ES705_35974 [subsurface metagenome]
MGSIAINKKLIDNHFRFLKNLDTDSKKRLIVRLTESIDISSKKDKLDKLFGAWKDSRDAEEIIRDIEGSRTSSKEIEEL